MGDDYGFVLAALFPTLILIVSFIILLMRHHQYVKSRNPSFLIVQNIGTVISFTLFSLSILKTSYIYNVKANCYINKMIFDFCMQLH